MVDVPDRYAGPAGTPALYYFSRPVPPEQFATLLRTGTVVPSAAIGH